MKTITINLPSYVVEFLSEEARRCGVTIDQMAYYFFAKKVVHT